MNENEKAILVALDIGEFFQRPDVIGIVGGTERSALTPKEKEEALSPIDFCLEGDFGTCNLFRRPELKKVKIPGYNAVFESPGKELLEMMKGRDVYQSGGYIANKASAFTMANVPAEKINNVTIAELIENARVPVTFDIAPLEVQPGDYQTSREKFRKGIGRNWILHLVNPDARYFIPTPTSDGYRQLEPEKVQKYLQTWIPAANGADFLVDYGILARVLNPITPKRDVLGIWGCHRWGTFAWNAVIMMAKEMPETENMPTTEIRGIDETLAFMYDVIKGEDLQHYEVIAAIFNRSPTASMNWRELTIAPVGIFEVPSQ